MSLFGFLKARWGSGDGEFDIARLDTMTSVLPVISYSHYAVHEGHSFKSDFVNEALGDNATIVLAFKTPAGTKRIHMLPEFVTLVGGDLSVWEGATWDTNSGVVNPIINRKREASMDSSVLLEDLTATPTFTATDNILSNPANLVTVGKTLIHHFYTWGAKGKFLAGGARDTEELILKPDETYAVVFTGDGAANKAQVILNWYEHTDSH